MQYSNIRAQVVDAVGTLSSFTFASVAGAHDLVAASDGSDYLIVYTDGSDAQADLYAVTLSSATGSLGTPFAITTAAASQSHAHIASNGTDFLVSWRSDDGLFFKRVQADGTVLDSFWARRRTRRGHRRWPEKNSEARAVADRESR